MSILDKALDFVKKVEHFLSVAGFLVGGLLILVFFGAMGGVFFFDSDDSEDKPETVSVVDFEPVSTNEVPVSVE